MTSARDEQQHSASPKSKRRKKNDEGLTGTARVLARLNESIAASINQKLAKDPISDLTSLVARHAKKYPLQRERCLPADPTSESAHHFVSFFRPPIDLGLPPLPTLI